MVTNQMQDIVILCRGQFCELNRFLQAILPSPFLSTFYKDWFDVVDFQNRPLLTEQDILRNLKAVVADADKLASSEAARGAIGV
jgi:hypothetical protein